MRYAVKKSAVFTQLSDGSAVVLDLESKVYFGLNESAMLVWQELAKGSIDEGSLVERVVAAYDVEEERAISDVRNLLLALREAELLDVIHD
jgi:hypothetical protein